MSDIKGISPSYCTHKILMEYDYKLVIQPQRHLNPKVQDVMKNEIVKLLDSRLIYLISDSSWVSPIHVVPKKGGMTVVLNNNNELIPFRIVTGWRVCINYRKINDATRKDHFPLPFNDQMLERLSNLDRMLDRCEETSLMLNWEKCHFMVKEEIVLGHKISGAGIEVDRAKIDVIAKLPYPTNVKGVRSFLGHAGFYRRNLTFRTAYKTPTRCTPFRLVSGKACHLPVEIEHKAYWALKQCNMDFTATAKNCFMELNELMELRDGAYEEHNENTPDLQRNELRDGNDSRPIEGDKHFKRAEDKYY
ncbi:hypothetical protein Tco_0736884 [Tanacetum coccineum]